MAQYTFFMDWIRNNQKPIKLTDLITEAKGEKGLAIDATVLNIY